jgi:hypothetical protein
MKNVQNWGSFDRIEWCSDMDIDAFFETAEKDTGTIEKWKKTLTQGRQGFGALLLILYVSLSSRLLLPARIHSLLPPHPFSSIQFNLFHPYSRNVHSEWGTTWPFLMPPVPAADIPFKDDIGKVVRTVLLPTILKNWKRAHGVPTKEGEGKVKKEEGNA